MRIEIGSIWREVDPRFERKVKVVGYCKEDPEKVLIETVDAWFRRKPTKASVKRFNGKRGGYEKVKP